MQTLQNVLRTLVVPVALAMVMPSELPAAPKGGGQTGSGGVVVDDLDSARELGMALPRKDDSSVRMLIDFAHARNQFAKAALIGSAHGKVGELASLVAKAGDRKLAAAILAADAMAGSHFADLQAATLYKNVEEARARTGIDPSEEKEKGKKGGKAAKAGRKVPGRRSSDAGLIGELLQDSDPETVRLALMAAAYGGDESLKARIAGMPVTGPAAAGAVLLYRVRTGEKLADEEASALFTQAMKSSVTSASDGGLSDFSLDLPGGIMACQAAALQKSQSLLPLLHAALASPDVRIQAEAARAIGAAGSPSSVPVLSQKLGDCSWPVLVEVTRALGAIPDARSITPLITRLRTEKGRFRLDVVYALSSIAGEQKGRTVADWESWWRKTGQAFVPDPGVTQAFRQKNRVQDMVVPSLGMFYSLPIYSDRLCFVVDSSQSMRGERIASLKANLTKAVETIADGVAYNIVNFGGVIEVMRRDSLVRDKRSGFRRIEEMGLSSGTRSYDAMEVGCRMEGVDTLYFLSDGKPTPSQVSEWGEIRRAIALCDRQRPLAIHVVEFNPEGNTEPMVEMADENGGLYEAVVLTGLPEEMDRGAPAAREPQDNKKKGGAKPAPVKGAAPKKR